MLAKPKITVDTNILVSAYAFPSALTQRFMEMAAERQFEICLSEEIVEEFGRVMELKLKFSPADCCHFTSHLRSISSIYKTMVKLNIVKNDPTDNKIIETAVSAGSSAIISGDKHLLTLNSYKNIQVIKLSDFIRSIYN